MEGGCAAWWLHFLTVSSLQAVPGHPSIPSLANQGDMSLHTPSRRLGETNSGKGAARGGDNHSKLVSGTLALHGQRRDLLPLAPHLGKGRGRGGQAGSPRPHGAEGDDDEAGGRLGARERAQHQQLGTALPVFTRFQWDGTSWGEGRHSRGGTRCGPPTSNCPSADQRPASRLSTVTPGHITSPHAAEGCWLRFGKP